MRPADSKTSCTLVKSFTKQYRRAEMGSLTHACLIHGTSSIVKVETSTKPVGS